MVEAKVSDVSPDGYGMRLFLNDRFEIDEPIELSLNAGSLSYQLQGTIRWRAGVDNTPEGTLTKTQHNPRSDEIETIDFYAKSLEEYWRAANGFDYVIGIRLNKPVPSEAINKLVM